MNKPVKLTGALALLSALLIGCSGTPGGSSSDVTLSGTVSNGASALSATSGIGIQKTSSGVTATAADYSAYTLYCVTLTVPTQSGSGNFSDADGDGIYSYNVTISDAADTPIGCFIVDGSDNIKATVSFNTGGGVSGSNSGAALTGGDHTVDIDFDPASGTATATVSATDVSENVSGTYSAAELINIVSGTWSMSCPDIDPNTAGTQTDPNCVDFTTGGNGTDHVYINMITGNMNGETVYAMGAWPDSTSFNTCGGHEGMNSTALASFGVTSTPTQGSSTNGSSAVGVFDGSTISQQSLVTAGAYPAPVYSAANEESTYTTTLDTIVNAIDPAGSVAYDDTWNDAWASNGHDGSDDWCPSTLVVDSNTLLNDSSNTGAEARSCYIGWVEHLAEQDAASPQTCMPRIDGGKAQDQVWTNVTPSTYPLASAISVPYRTNLGGISPEIAGRFSLMGAEILGDAIVAYDHHQDQWSDWDNVNNVSISCERSDEMTIQLTPTSTTSATGRFTQKEWQYCSNSSAADPAPITFEVSFTKTADAL